MEAESGAVFFDGIGYSEKILIKSWRCILLIFTLVPWCFGVVVEQNGDKKRILYGIGIEIKTWSRVESRPAPDITGVDYCVDFVRIKVFHSIS